MTTPLQHFITRNDITEVRFSIGGDQCTITAIREDGEEHPFAVWLAELIQTYLWACEKLETEGWGVDRGPTCITLVRPAV